MANSNKLITKTREQLFDMYMDSLSRDELPWEKPWKSSDLFNPKNPVSGVTYKGVNRMLLGMISFSERYNDPRWATFNQAIQLLVRNDR